MRQVTRWLFAAAQDRHPGVKFLHASYGIANLDIIRQVTSDDVIRRVTGEDPVPLQLRLQQLQDQAQAAMKIFGEEEAMYDCPNQWEGNSGLGELGAWWGYGSWSGWGWWPWNWGLKPVRERGPMHRSQWDQQRRMGYSDQQLYDFWRRF